MQHPWPERREALRQERDTQVRAATTPHELVQKCVALITSTGRSAEYSWSDSNPLLTIAYMDVDGEKGLLYGYGKERLEAAIQCFTTIWFDCMVLPHAPSPTAAELSLQHDGQAIHAIRAFMQRTGVSLYEARRILKA